MTLLLGCNRMHAALLAGAPQGAWPDQAADRAAASHMRRGVPAHAQGQSTSPRCSAAATATAATAAGIVANGAHELQVVQLHEESCMCTMLAWCRAFLSELAAVE
jgi:hypothetical protein